MKYGLIFLLINTQKLEIPQIILKSHPLQSKIVPKLTYNSNSCKTSSDTSVDKKVEEKSFATAEVATLMAPEGDDASHHTQIPSNESLPKLPQELITAILTFDLDYPVKQPKRIVRVLGSVNGFNFYRIWFNSLVLWNPSTGKYKQLPDLMPTQMVTTGYCFNYGFGYDEVHNDYKIVALFREISKHCVDAKIYSLKSDSWRILDDAQGEMLYDGSGKLVNGKLHWVTIVDGGWSIMSIDMVDEKCRKVEQPYYGVDQFSLTLGVLGSDMCVLCSHERTDVWVMKDYGVKESWTKMYTIKSPK
ncbi:putative 60S ribosomal protein L13a-4-like [Capsicum annuum]|nr:putative 60S ribosomal protein L13a-4-like [Capsicum annuum]